MSEYNITLEDLLRAWGDVIKARHLYLRYRNPRFSTDSGVDNEWSALNHEDYIQALSADHRNGIDFRALPSEWYKYVLNAEKEFSNLADKYALQLANSLPNGLALLDNIHAHRNYLYAKGKRDALFPETLDFSSPLWTNATQLVFDWEYVHDQNKAQGALHLVNADTDLAPYYDLVDAINRYNTANEAEAQRRLSMQDYLSGTVEDQRRLVSDQLTDATYVDLPLSRIIPIINAPKIEQQQYYLDQYNEPYPWEERLSPEQIEQIANAYEMMSGAYAPFGSPGMSSMLSHSREWALAHPYLAQEIVNTAIDINPTKVAIEQLPWFAAPAIIGSGIRTVGTILKGVNSLSKAGEWTYNIGNKLGRLLSIAEADRVAGILADGTAEGATGTLGRVVETVPANENVAINLGNGELRAVGAPATAESLAGEIAPEAFKLKPELNISEMTAKDLEAYDLIVEKFIEDGTEHGLTVQEAAEYARDIVPELVETELLAGAENATEAINTLRRALVTGAVLIASLVAAAEGEKQLAEAGEDENNESSELPDESIPSNAKTIVGTGLIGLSMILGHRLYHNEPKLKANTKTLWYNKAFNKYKRWTINAGIFSGSKDPKSFWRFNRARTKPKGSFDEALLRNDRLNTIKDDYRIAMGADEKPFEGKDLADVKQDFLDKMEKRVDIKGETVDEKMNNFGKFLEDINAHAEENIEYLNKNEVAKALTEPIESNKSNVENATKKIDSTNLMRKSERYLLNTGRIVLPIMTAAGVTLVVVNANELNDDAIRQQKENENNIEDLTQTRQDAEHVQNNNSQTKNDSIPKIFLISRK